MLTLGDHPKPAKEVITDSGEKTPENPPPQPSNPSPTAGACEPYRETIESWLDRGRNAMAIWQDLVDQHGYGGGYQTVNRFVRRYLERHPQLSLRHVDPLIRELTEYRDLINLKTKEESNESD